jgi:hypothetical protein
MTIESVEDAILISLCMWLRIQTPKIRFQPPNTCTYAQANLDDVPGHGFACFLR